MIELNFKSSYLSYDFINKLKNPERFWTQSIGDRLYLLDASSLDIFEFQGKLREIFSLDGRAEFNQKVEALDWEDVKQYYGLVNKILKYDPLPSEITSSKQIINELHINTNNTCNLACKYCFKDKKSFSLTDWSVVYKAIDFLIGDCGKDAQNYQIAYGLTGEPLLDFSGLKRIFIHIKKLEKEIGKKINLYFLTNGTVLNNEMVRFFLKTGYNKSFHISIDGSQEVHDQVRQFHNGEGTFSIIKENIHTLKHHNFVLNGNAVITKKFPYPQKILDDLLNLGIDKVLIKPIRPGSELDFKEDDLDNLKRGYDAYFEMLYDDISNYRYYRLEKYSGDFPMRFVLRILLKHKVKRRCRWGTKELAVNHRGEFYPCDSTLNIEEFKIGDLHQGIEWVKYLKDIDVAKRGLCSTCWCRNICGGTCFFGAWITKGDIMAIDPIECELNKYLIESSARLIFRLINKRVNLTEIKDFYIKQDFIGLLG